jgi:hypothetical protein
MLALFRATEESQEKLSPGWSTVFLIQAHSEYELVLLVQALTAYPLSYRINILRK